MSSPNPPIPPISNQTTTVGYDQVSALCSSVYTGNIITGVVTRLLQEHFYQLANIIYNGTQEAEKIQLSGYVWTPDSKTTKIQIQPVWLFNPEDIARRPALYVKRNKWQTLRETIDDGMTVNARPDSQGNVSQVRGEYHSKRVTGSHTIFCVAKDGAAAELLAGEVFDFAQSFGPILRRDLKLHRVEVAEMGPISQIETAIEAFTVPVVLAYGFYQTWRLEAVAPWLKNVSIKLNT